VDSVTQGKKTLRLRGLGLATHPALTYVTLVLLLQRSPALMALRHALWSEVLSPLRESADRFGMDPSRFPTPLPYMPHVSVMYDSKQALSPLAREEVLEREVPPVWAEVTGEAAASAAAQAYPPRPPVARMALQGLQFDVGRIALVETTAAKYELWPELGHIDLSCAGAAADEGSPAEEPAPPASDPAWFASMERQPLSHASYLRLARELHDRRHPRQAACLILDGQVVLSGGGDNGEKWERSPWTTAAAGTHHHGPHPLEQVYATHFGAEAAARASHACIRLVVHLERLCAVSDDDRISVSPATTAATAAHLFDRTRRKRMLLYTLHEPCAACQHAVEQAGLHVIVFGHAATATDGCAVDSAKDLRKSDTMLVLGPMLKGSEREQAAPLGSSGSSE